MTRVTSQALNNSYENERRKRCVFRRLWKTGRDDADVTWRGAAGRSRCGQRRQEKLARRQSSAVYGGPAEMVSTPIVGGFWSWDLQAGGVHRPDTSVPFRGCIYTVRTASLMNLLWSFQGVTEKPKYVEICDCCRCAFYNRWASQQFPKLTQLLSRCILTCFVFVDHGSGGTWQHSGWEIRTLDLPIIHSMSQNYCTEPTIYWLGFNSTFTTSYIVPLLITLTLNYYN